MGRKGWAGTPPADDAEARKRIIDTTRRITDRRGAAQTTVADVADALGISRRTVYNYFTSSEELFTAVAQLTLQGFVADVKSIIADLDVTAQLIEMVAYIIERHPREPQLALLLANDRSYAFSRAMLSSSVIARGREFLHQAHIDWAALGYDDRTVDELVEFPLHIIQSMVVAPPESPRTGSELRAYLRRWIGPALS
jgi:AcrR family transcriptional regulator